MNKTRTFVFIQSKQRDIWHQGDYKADFLFQTYKYIFPMVKQLSFEAVGLCTKEIKRLKICLERQMTITSYIS